MPTFVVNAADTLGALSETVTALSPRQATDTLSPILDSLLSPVSAWRITGVVTGDGANGYRFVGTPTVTLIAQDSAASTWTVSVAVSGSKLVVTATGENGRTIRWNAVAKLAELAGA